MNDALIRHHRTPVGQVSLHVASSGDGPPVVLLHGFPEFWYSWRHQVEALARRGFTAIAPDLRGYNDSDRPSGVAKYRCRELVADVAGLIRSLAGGRATVVGHDWGGIVAWRLAALHPELVSKLVILNSPHPLHYRRTLLRSPLQIVRSSYAGFFQVPYLPERLIAAGDFRLVERVLQREPRRPDAFTHDDIAQYKQALRKGLSEPLHYYRAALRYGSDLFSEPQAISMPTLVIWGENDPYLSLKLTQGLERYVPNLRIERLPGVSHWVQNDSAEQVNELLLSFAAV
jgi:epoxide hydrolase 4